MGALNIRHIDDNLHREAKVAAAKGGVSLQAWISQAIKEKLERDKTKN